MKRLVIATAFGALLGVGLSIQFGAFGTGAIAQSSRETATVYRDLELFGDILDRVRADYVEPVKEGKLIESAVNGMLSSLDPHSSYLSPASFDDMREQTSGKFGGLGIEVTMESGFVKVVAPIDDTPASRAGMKAGDYITHLNGEQILGLTLAEAVEKMRGEVGSTIKLTVVRKGVEEPFEVSITRAIITIKAVKSRLEGDIGYVRITTFNEQTTRGLQAAIKSLREKAGDKKLRGFVVDLRNNPGGLLDQAVSVTDTFLERGEIVSTLGRDKRRGSRFEAKPGDLTAGLPIVILINSGSASASEIVAGALQDHRRAVIVGEKSFGKGSVQTIVPLSNGGALRLTTQRYYTPSGRSIQKLGIEPDILVKPLKLADEKKASARRRSEASLPGSLENDRAKAEEKKKKSEAGKADAARKHREELIKSDYQLAYALDLIRGVTAFRKLGEK
ncbi:MAG: S41 family peptidase [Neomegalonema sp.]|nr:S41 family peptidase [Neomegalonema sp.]